MVQGCRPTSAVNHPVSVAMKPSGNEQKVAHKNQRFRSSPPLVMKRFHTRGRGRSAQVQKFFSNLTVVVRERDEETA